MSGKIRAERRAEIVKALAHPSRIQIAEALTERAYCVQELTELVGADMSTVSKHLTLMKAAGLVLVEKRGLNHYYRLRCPCLGDIFDCIDFIAQTQTSDQQKAYT